MPRRRRRSSTSIGGTIAILILLALIYLARNWDIAAQPGRTPSSGETVISVAPDATPASVVPKDLPKPSPVANTYKDCPPDGDGGDRELNILKNRTDIAPFTPVTLEALLALRWPVTAENNFHSRWSAADRTAIKLYEGAAVSTVGYLLLARSQGPESPNCHSPDEVDRHLWIVVSQNEDRATSLVVETTPRVAASHPEWTTAALNQLANVKARVRINGWLLFDQEHPDQLGNTRGSLWEIHPVMKIEVDRGNGFIELGR